MFNHAFHGCKNCSTDTTLSAYEDNAQGIYEIMLLHYKYFDKRSLVDIDLKLALTHLSQSEFVGLTEEWREPFDPEFIKYCEGVSTSPNEFTQRNIQMYAYSSVTPPHWRYSEKNRTGLIDWIDEELYRK